MSHPDSFEFTPLVANTEIAPHAASYGIVVHPPEGVYSYWPADGQIWKSIGHITVDTAGRIELWPFCGLSDAEATALDDCGVDAIAHPPNEISAWRRGGDGRWHCDVSILPHTGDPFAEQVRACERLVIRRPQRLQMQGAA
ncbi:hypothetical protein [Nocardia ignorata]|uniref:Uncharacterized protein n=1 Tax=Nocardia ignorata TaxID=145285 RepID=A0A4R6NZC2_NOCIG|nr:hypothetical protein [Nocardia ignorata]TDP29903.1 hypothetical protein DFR75_112172 [Nocardia ignorata]